MNSIAFEKEIEIYNIKRVFKTLRNKKDYVKVFVSKKLKRNGLLEKKRLKLSSKLKRGRWDKTEHANFIRACVTYGSKWKKVISIVKIYIDTGRG
jgi:hypothetical protein